MNLILSLLAGLAGLYILICTGLFFFQRKIIYLPDATPVRAEDHNLPGFNTLQIPGENVTLTAWHHPAPTGADTIVYFHGNAGTLVDRRDKFSAFAARGYGVLAVSYRGYSGSSGTPTEQGLYSDAHTAMAYAKSQGVTPENLILYGESLGTGVATKIAAEHPAKALILEAPYTSVANRGAERYRIFPVRHLIHDHFNSKANLPHIHTPLLIIHGEEDETIPITHGRAMFEAANQPKKALLLPGIGHTDIPVSLIVESLYEWANSQK